MTISISPQAYDELCQQETVEWSQHPDPNDALDVMFKHPTSLGPGYWRYIELRQGLMVTIGDFRLCDRLLTTYPEEEERWLAYHFHFSGTHHARDILLQRLDNPPSLMELARQAGLNECTLKRGFRQVFGKTAFSYLHDYRLEQARQLLTTGEMKVMEVAQAIGFADRSYFAAAFRKKFGCNPSALKRKH